jgi:hypothetical protein
MTLFRRFNPDVVTLVSNPALSIEGLLQQPE